MLSLAEYILCYDSFCLSAQHCISLLSHLHTPNHFFLPHVYTQWYKYLYVCNTYKYHDILSTSSFLKSSIPELRGLLICVHHLGCLISLLHFCHLGFSSLSSWRLLFTLPSYPVFFLVSLGLVWFWSTYNFSSFQSKGVCWAGRVGSLEHLITFLFCFYSQLAGCKFLG